MDNKQTYSDYDGFSETYFTGGISGGYGSWPPEHIDYGTYAEELLKITGHVKLLVVGCATGESLHALRTKNRIDAYGMDISQWAVDNAIPSVQDVIYQGDACDQDRFDEIARETDGPPRWGAVYTELVLSHYDDEQAREIYDNCREAAEGVGDTDGVVVHRIASASGRQEYNTKTVDEWLSLCGDHDDVEWVDYDAPEDSTI